MAFNLDDRSALGGSNQYQTALIQPHFSASAYQLRSKTRDMLHLRRTEEEHIRDLHRNPNVKFDLADSEETRDEKIQGNPNTN